MKLDISQLFVPGFSCCGEIANFSENSDPFQMHKDMFPECLFVKKVLQQSLDLSSVKHETSCLRCEINEKNIICEPCKHLAYCSGCKLLVDHCAYCSSKCTSFREISNLETVDIDLL